jgi:hypothetical protein
VLFMKFFTKDDIKTQSVSWSETGPVQGQQVEKWPQVWCFLKWFPSLHMKLFDFSTLFWVSDTKQLSFDKTSLCFGFFYLKKERQLCFFAECSVYKGISILFKTMIKFPTINEPKSLSLTSWMSPSLFSFLHSHFCSSPLLCPRIVYCP